MTLLLSEVYAAAAALGAALSDNQIATLARYRDLVLTGNERVNLTAVRDPDAFERLHLLDAVGFFRAVEPSELAFLRLIDVGSGAGLPGLPLAIMAPGLRLTLVEATGKKAAFLHSTATTLGLPTIDVQQGRAEDLGHRHELRERFHLATARAVAELATLVELCLPFLRVGGRLLAAKKIGIDAEIASAQAALRQVGGTIEACIPVNMPGLEDRQIVVIRKIDATPERFPRRAGVPEHQPLR